MAQVVLIVDPSTKDKIKHSGEILIQLRHEINDLGKTWASEMRADKWDNVGRLFHDFCMLSKEIEVSTAGNDKSGYDDSEQLFMAFLDVASSFIVEAKSAISSGTLQRPTRKIHKILCEAEAVRNRIQIRLDLIFAKRERIPQYERAKAALINA